MKAVTVSSYLNISVTALVHQNKSIDTIKDCIRHSVGLSLRTYSGIAENFFYGEIC